jgi:hypothetical protein
MRGLMASLKTLREQAGGLSKQFAIKPKEKE